MIIKIKLLHKPHGYAYYRTLHTTNLPSLLLDGIGYKGDVVTAQQTLLTDGAVSVGDWHITIHDDEEVIV